MLKHEFEKMMFLDGAEVSADFFESVNVDYMKTNETKEQYIARVFGTNALRCVSDAEWIFKRYLENTVRALEIKKDILRLEQEFFQLTLHGVRV